MTIHVVQAGETIDSIARQYGVNPQRLQSDNAVPANGAMAVGQTLVIRFPQVVHVVQAGESLGTIAANYNITVRQLWQNNWYLGGEAQLYPGNTLVISYLEEKLGAAYFYGYAYPFIDPALLNSQLPYQSYPTPLT